MNLGREFQVYIYQASDSGGGMVISPHPNTLTEHYPWDGGVRSLLPHRIERKFTRFRDARTEGSGCDVLLSDGGFG
jgi:hypothetical protein